VPRLGLTMIIKDDAATLRRCLESVRGVVDEAIVFDTGSTDSSRDIARKCGASVFSIPWENDFAKARNTALAASTADWVLALDGDEELDRDVSRAAIAPLLQPSSVGGYVVPIRNYLLARHGSINGNRAKPNDGRCERAKDAPAYAENFAVRLFRRHPMIHYQGCIHEAVAPQIVASGFQLRTAPFCLHHVGFLAKEQEGDKAAFYLELLRKKAKQEPENPLAWLELARQLHAPFCQHEEALRCIERALTLEPRMTGARFLAGAVNLALGRDRDALAALELCGEDREYAAEREHCRGDALHNLGMLPEARTAYRKSLELVGHDPQIESKLGYVEVKLGEKQSGFLKMQRALAALPLGAELHERLIKAYLTAGMLPEAAEAAETFAATVLHPTTILRAAAIRAHMKQQEQAQKLILRGLEFFPQSPELQRAHAELGRR
jgi:hypothetical protein